MPDIFFTTNPADFGKLEGLYVSERKPPGFIRGADLFTVGLAGKCVRGPLTPQVITTSGQFEQMYGTRNTGSDSALVGEVWAALLNKPFGTIVVRRVAASDATVATHTFSDAVPTAILAVDASSVGSWGKDITATVEDATDGDALHFNVRISYLGREWLYQNLNFQGGLDNSLALVGTDPTRPVTLRKLASGRPVNGSSALTTGGSDGALVAADYNAGLDDLAVYPGVSYVTIPEATPTPATVHAHIVTLAPTVADRAFLTWSMVHGQSQAAEVTSKTTAITTPSDRIWWCYNSTFTIDPVTNSEIEQGPHISMASILSQIDVDIHPGSYQTQALLAGVTRVANTNLSRGDLIALKAAGISTLERLSDGFQFHSAVTTTTEAGLTEITRRRMADWLQLSASARLRTYAKGKNTPEIRAQMGGELTAFSSQLKRKGRVVQDFEVDQTSVNTDELRAQGEEHLLWRVKLISHMLAIVFETDISTGTVIAKAA